VGNKVTVGETGIAEGWNVPLYQNEFQNMIGLPLSEDHSLRIRKPRQECFNCLSTSHRMSECPVKVDRERCEIHRNFFNTQSMYANEQSQLYANRYTSDIDSNTYRGFTPGKISDQLREALGITANQLPPYIYMMRRLGYPTGWLIEAQVKNAKLSVLDDPSKNADSADKENESIVKEEEQKSIFFPTRNKLSLLFGPLINKTNFKPSMIRRKYSLLPVSTRRLLKEP
jgi:hypothetical protein